MKSGQKLKKRSPKSSAKRLPDVHNSLDAPVFVWDKVHQTGDLSWLMVKRMKFKRLSKQVVAILENAWENIYNEFIGEFGFSEQFLSIMEKKMEIAQLKCALVLTGDRINLTWISIAEEELQDMEGRNNKGNFMEAKVATDKRMGFQINMHTTSIREYYYYLKNPN